MPTPINNTLTNIWVPYKTTTSSNSFPTSTTSTKSDSKLQKNTSFYSIFSKQKNKLNSKTSSYIIPNISNTNTTSQIYLYRFTPTSTRHNNMKYYKKTQNPSHLKSSISHSYITTFPFTYKI